MVSYLLESLVLSLPFISVEIDPLPHVRLHPHSRVAPTEFNLKLVHAHLLSLIHLFLLLLALALE